MRIQYCSDIHLISNTNTTAQQPAEFFNIVEPVAPVLALLGDIGAHDSVELRTFLRWCCSQWIQVLYVPGNNEFWRLSHESIALTPDNILTNLRTFEKEFPNLKLCWRTSFVGEDGNIILATPLWRPPLDDNDNSDTARVFDLETCSRLYKEEIHWLQNELRKHIHKQVVVLTHYAPFFVTTHNFLKAPIVAWICGYDHTTLNWMKPWETTTGESGTILLVSNPYGYNKSNPDFRADAVLNLPKQGRM